MVEAATAAAAEHGAAQVAAGYRMVGALARSEGTWQYVGPEGLLQQSQATVPEAGSSVGSRVDPGGRSLSNVAPDGMASGFWTWLLDMVTEKMKVGTQCLAPDSLPAFAVATRSVATAPDSCCAGSDTSLSLSEWYTHE